MTAQKNILVIGAGESGTGAALLAHKLDWTVFVTEYGKINEYYTSQLVNAGIPFEENGHTQALAHEYDLIVTSPGVPSEAPILTHFRDKGTEIISEIELAWRHRGNGKLIGITGSNGKSTVTKLIHHTLTQAGLDAALVGNIGQSFAATVSEREYAWYVCELSSFQLDDISTLKPHAAIITNITPDHLDRYKHDFSLYVQAKMNITKNQDPTDLLVVNGGDEATMAAVNTKAKLITVTDQVTPGQYVSSGMKVYAFGEAHITGRHNWMNIAQSIEVMEFIGLDQADIQLGIVSYLPLAHRMEICGTVDGVKYINDSKATNIDSVKYALDAMNSPVVWIAGGTDKGNDYSVLLALVKEKVKWLVCLGVDNSRLIAAFSGHVPGISEAGSMVEAIELAGIKAVDGDVVLLSPACASFDLFKNYIDRGDQFKEAIRRLEAAQKRAGSGKV
jgi:UDP-N-acetylmuramoylalanine--D-glutamate ligase